MHRYLASLPALKLIVHAWYDDLPQKALAGREGWGIVQGVSQSEHFGTWTHYFAGRRSAAMRADAESFWMPLLYQPLGSVSPAAELPRFGFRLCRGADRNRHPDADPRSRAEHPQGPELSVSRVPLLDADRAHLRAADHEAILRSALGRSAGGADAQRGEVPGAASISSGSRCLWRSSPRHSPASPSTSSNRRRSLRKLARLPASAEA